MRYRKKIIELEPTCKPKKTQKQVKLYNYQIPHYENVEKILKENNFAIDLSKLGSGKTYIACKYLQVHKFKNVYIFCPASLRKKWQTVSIEYNIPVYVCSYNEMTSTKYNQPKHGLLIRDEFAEQNDVDDIIPSFKKNIEIIGFNTSEKYNEMVEKKRGVCFIFDEFQHIRTEFNGTTRAARALMRPLIHNTNDNKIFLISGTPIDKKDQYVTFFRNIGIQQKNMLFRYIPGNGQSVKEGYQEIIDFCKNVDKEHKFDKLLTDAATASSRLTALRHLENMFINVIKYYFASTMQMEKSNVDITNINSFYQLEGEDLKLHKSAISKILKVLSSDAVHTTKRIWVFKALQLLEFSKINTIAREVTNLYNTNKNCKIVITMNYTDSLNGLYKKLEKLKPIILNGTVLPDDRNDIINKFQKNNAKVRVLLCNLRVVCSGIDLDDKFGDYPRFVFVSPSYSTIDMYQHSCRYLRALDTKSNTIIRYVYSTEGIISKKFDTMKQMQVYSDKFKTEKQEEHILKVVSKKTVVMSNVSEESSMKFMYQVIA